jgi:hypothetical protein
VQRHLLVDGDQPHEETLLGSPDDREALAKLLGTSVAFMKTGYPPPDDMLPPRVEFEQGWVDETPSPDEDVDSASEIQR